MSNETWHEANGRFKPGNPGGGRHRETEVALLALFSEVVPPKRWRAIIEKAAQQAERGDDKARRWLSEYHIGKPPERVEVETPVVLHVVYENPPKAEDAVPT